MIRSAVSIYMKRHLNRITSRSGGRNLLVTHCQKQFDPSLDTAFILSFLFSFFCRLHHRYRPTLNQDNRDQNTLGDQCLASSPIKKATEVLLLLKIQIIYIQCGKLFT
jgi:hypothetical protein